MKLKREYIIGILVIGFLAAFYLTPIGFHAKVYLNRLVSHNPTPVAEREQEVLADYSWELEDLNGNMINLKDYRGKIILINFWASWCPPCIAEMPGFELLYKDYGDEIAFLFIARDKEEKIRQFLDRKGYTLPVYFEGGFTPKVLFNAALPTTYIIDGKGKIIMAEVGSRDWNSSETRSFLDAVLADSKSKIQP